MQDGLQIIKIIVFKKSNYLLLFSLFRFVVYYFPSIFFISVYFVLLSLVSFHFVSISLISFRFVSFRFRWFRFVSFLFRFALYRYPSPTKLRRNIVTLPSVLVRPSSRFPRPSFRNILVNTLESTSFNGFWSNLVHT
jgi:hypothetical protein